MNELIMMVIMETEWRELKKEAQELIKTQTKSPKQTDTRQLWVHIYFHSSETYFLLEQSSVDLVSFEPG